jgi:2,3-bisphosphoglycerate-independent phosphoglycerate mutase
MIAPTAIIRGIGETFGVSIIDVPNTTGYYNSDIIAKMRTAVEYITKDEYDFGFVHIKAVDDAGHDKSYKIKVE